MRPRHPLRTTTTPSQSAATAAATAGHRRFGVTLLLAALCWCSAPGQADETIDINSLSSVTLQNVRLVDHTFAELRGGASITVVAFMGTECPLARIYAPVLERMHQQFRGDGVRFLALFPNVQDSWNDIAQFAADHQLGIPLLKDQAQQAVQILGATRTPEIVVIDAQNRIRYRGMIDDRCGLGFRLPAAKHTYLHDALTALLSQKEVGVAVTKPVGCLITRRQQNPATNTQTTWARQISRIF